MGLIKLFHYNDFKAPLTSLISPLTEITLDKGAKLSIGNGFKMRDGAKLRIRKNAECIIGSNTSVNSNNMIACHEKIIIGNNVQLSPNVQIYDHDHDFKVEGGIKKMRYRTSPVEIGNNVWIGANSVILRGTKIGDNSVIAAGSIIKGDIPSDSVVYQKKASTIKFVK